jgi:hypothetical protein
MEQNNEVRITGSILLKRGLKADLEVMEEILDLGEPVYEIDGGKLKVGDGESPYADLPYLGADEENFNALKEKVEAFLADADVSQEAVDTLKEIQDLLNSTDTDVDKIIAKITDFETLHGNLSDSITSLNKALDDEKTRASAEEGKIRNEFAKADTDLHTTISAEIDKDVKVVSDDLDVFKTSISTSLNSEITRATKAEAQVLTDAKSYTNEVKNQILGEGIKDTFDTLVEI